MVNVVFIRHAESEYNRDGIWAGRADCNLTEKGIEAAKKLGQNLKDDFDVIYCSPLKRTKQTLNSIFPNVTPIYDDRIIEISIGVWENKKKKLFDDKLIDLFRKGLYTPPGAETHEDVDKRVISFIEDIFTNYNNNEKILVVTHNGVMRSIKRLFIKSQDILMSKNLETITLSNIDYKRFKEGINEKYCYVKKKTN